MQIKTGFFITAVLLAGCGGGGSDNPSVPDAPTAVQSSVVNSDVTLSWSVVSGADSYHIYYSTDPKLDTKNYAVYANSGWIKNVASPYIVKSLAVAPIYYFAVTAVGKGGESEASSLVAGVTRYEIIGVNDEIVRDKVTNLEWQRCSLGQVWNKSGKTCDGLPTKYYADKIVPFLTADKDGWRIPTRDEITSLLFCDIEGVDYFWSSLNQCDTKGNKIAKSPLIKQDIFPNTGQERKYHVSDDYPDSYCSVGFGFNSVGICAGGKDYVALPLPNYLRLVRDVAKP